MRRRRAEEKASILQHQNKRKEMIGEDDFTGRNVCTGKLAASGAGKQHSNT